MVYVFKTTVKIKKEVERLEPQLNEVLEQNQWNFDLEDCDKILRVESLTNVCDEVVEILQEHGFECEELVD